MNPVYVYIFKARYRSRRGKAEPLQIARWTVQQRSVSTQIFLRANIFNRGSCKAGGVSEDVLNAERVFQ